MWLGQRFERARQEWRQLSSGQPGRRFVHRYDRRREAHGRPSLWGRIRAIGGVVLLIGIGLVLAFLPGPAVLFYALAAGLLATQSRRVAAWLDCVELALRKQIRRFRRWRERRSAERGSS